MDAISANTCAIRGPTSYPGSLPMPGAAEKTLAGAGHVNTNIFGGKLKIT